MTMPETTQLEILVNQVLRLQKLQDQIKFNSMTDDSKINTKLIELINKRIDQIEKEIDNA
jgi:hypothetical protein